MRLHATEAKSKHTPSAYLVIMFSTNGVATRVAVAVVNATITNTALLASAAAAPVAVACCCTTIPSTSNIDATTIPIPERWMVFHHPCWRFCFSPLHPTSPPFTSPYLPPPPPRSSSSSSSSLLFAPPRSSSSAPLARALCPRAIAPPPVPRPLREHKRLHQYIHKLTPIRARTDNFTIQRVSFDPTKLVRYSDV
jgi:hypothetical protein